ncbi:MAG: DUF1697 domain-containing protein [Candidatus Korobacteraceae bacterium]|jgi:uncharacterized protein (DUF1697 family)
MLEFMPVLISMLRGVNVTGYNKIPMEALRQLYESLGLRAAQTYIQSGNVVFKSNAKDLSTLAKRIEDAIEKKFSFRPAVTLRTTAELKSVIARNPFAERREIEPGKLLVNFFLTTEPGAEMRSEILRLKAGHPEELAFGSRELYIYFPDGQGRSKLWPAIDRALKKSGTGRNWNTVTKLLDMAEKLEGSRSLAAR